MKNPSKSILLVFSIACVGTAGYFLARKSKSKLREEILNNVPPNDQQRISSILIKMTRQELVDVNKAVRIPENITQSELAQISPALKMRVAAISKKYNLFT